MKTLQQGLIHISPNGVQHKYKLQIQISFMVRKNRVFDNANEINSNINTDPHHDRLALIPTGVDPVIQCTHIPFVQYL